MHHRIHRLGATFLTGLLLATLSVAADDAKSDNLHEDIPKGVTPDAGQGAVVRAVAERVIGVRVEYDERGNVRSMYISNHGKDTPRSVKDKDAYAKSRPGCDDATFARLAELPALKELYLLKQPLGDDAFAVLKNWPDLEVFCIENHIGDDTGRFMLHVNGHPELRWLELKHLFGLDGTTVDQLETFPKLLRLELDNASATNKALPFLKRNPTVIDFELHRTSMNNDEIGQLVEALPNLQRLALKPGNGKCFDHGALQHVRRLKHLSVFGFHHWKDHMYVWEDGLEHLAAMPKLRYLELPEKQWNLPAMQKLREARPDIQHVQGKQLIATFGMDNPEK